jgi:hypothetical protein
VAVPVNVLYFPAAHAAHGPTFGPVDPALQVQLVKAALPSGEVEFDGQALHVEFAEAPTAVEYVPPKQFVQAAVPVNTLYFPAAHAAHEPPFAPVDPALQVQLVEDAFPSGELEFDGQEMHVWAPIVVEYFPAMHAAHGPPFGPIDPMLQVQLVKAELPEGELEFDAQSEQVAFPVNVLYLPATHAVHGPPSCPVHPALQMQFVFVPLPAGELDFAGQSLQYELLQAPTVIE